MSDTDIVFINPPLSQEERYGVKFKAGGQTPPTGLALLAAICRNKDYTVNIIDAPALNLSIKSILTEIKFHNPKYVGITSSTIAIYNVKELALEIKKQNPDIKIILGGAHITAVPEETIERMGWFFDIAVIGEADITILELIDALEHNKPLKQVKGIAYKENDRLIFTEKREILMNLDSLPLPAWDLLPDLAKYYTPPAHTVKRFPAALLVTSRGCSGSCTFCDRSVFGNRLRGHSADYIINMIKHLKKNYGIKEIQFRDDNLLVFKNTVTKLCERLIKEKINIIWSCTGRIDSVNIDYLKLLKKAGCWQIWYGIESGCDRVLKVMKKNINVEKIRKVVNDTHNVGISVGGFFILGTQTETEDEIKQTIKFMLELPIDEFHYSFLVPFPGSEIYKTASSYGYFNNDWKKLNGWVTSFVTQGLSHEKLAYYSNLAFRKFYFRPRIIFNYIKRIRSFRALKVYFTALFGLIAMTSKKVRKA